VNGRKTKQVLIGLIVKERPTSGSVVVHGARIDRVLTVKLLGDRVSGDLKWMEQLDEIDFKAASRPTSYGS